MLDSFEQTGEIIKIDPEAPINYKLCKDRLIYKHLKDKLESTP